MADETAIISVWQRILAEHNFTNHLVVSFEPSIYYAGLIKAITINNNGVSLVPSKLWQLNEKYWIKTENLISWKADDERLSAPRDIGDFFLWKISDMSNIYLYTGDDPNEGLKLKQLPPPDFNN